MNYPKPDKKLRNAFEKWLKHASNMPLSGGTMLRGYMRASMLLRGITATSDEAHGLIEEYSEHRLIGKSGTFLSVIYNRSDEDVIVYDMEHVVEGLAYSFRKGASFVNLGRAGDYMGYSANGAIINLDKKTNDCMGQGPNGLCVAAKGPFINYGKIGECGAGISSLLVNLGHTENLLGANSSGCIVNLGFAEYGFGYCSKGMVVDNGGAGVGFAEGSEGIAVSTKPEMLLIRDYPAGYGALLHERMLEIKGYLDTLHALFQEGSKDYRKVLCVLDLLGETPEKKVSSNIESILKPAYLPSKTH